MDFEEKISVIILVVLGFFLYKACAAGDEDRRTRHKCIIDHKELPDPETVCWSMFVQGELDNTNE